MRDSDFTKVPNKIFRIGLDPYDIAVYVALLSHGGKNGSDIFPSWVRIQELLPMSKDRIWKSLVHLREAGVIHWERGFSGRANTYWMNKPGLWSIRQTDATSIRQTDSYSPPDRPASIRLTEPNHIHLNQNHEPEEESKPMTKSEAKKRFGEIFAMLSETKREEA